MTHSYSQILMWARIMSLWDMRFYLCRTVGQRFCQGGCWYALEDVVHVRLSFHSCVSLYDIVLRGLMGKELFR